MEMHMRHWAIIAGASVTIAAMFNDISFDQLVPFYGFISAIVIGDKALSFKK